MFVLVWAASTAGYVLFAGQSGADELAAAALCGLVAAAWSACVRQAGARRLRFGWGAAAALARAFAGLPRATATVAGLLVRALLGSGASAREPGSVLREPFVRGRDDDAWDAGRRAVAVLARSLAPDSVVVRTPGDRDEIDVHQLSPSAGVEDSRWAI